MLKKLSFSRTNTPFYKESVATNEGTTNLRMKEVYDVDIKMFGNNVYRPGDYLYVEPLFYTGHVAVDLQDKLGLGGYYQIIDSDVSITENIYETNLKGVLYAHVTGSNGNKKVVTKDSDGGEC